MKSRPWAALGTSFFRLVPENISSAAAAPCVQHSDQPLLARQVNRVLRAIRHDFYGRIVVLACSNAFRSPCLSGGFRFALGLRSTGIARSCP